MKILATSFQEFKEAGLVPYRTAENPWNFLLYREDGKFGFSLNRHTPTAWTGPCENGCQDGWHSQKCVIQFREKMRKN